VIFVDTSVWIDYFNGSITPQVRTLHDALGHEAIAIGDLIALEILQGFRQDKDYATAKDMLAALTVYDLLGGTAIHSCAENYRKLRKKGITVRKNADLIIATFCIDNGFPLLFSDRDFLPFIEYLGLQSAA
jgi:predicted nucleic acid-binding protein